MANGERNKVMVYIDGRFEASGTGMDAFEYSTLVKGDTTLTVCAIVNGEKVTPFTYRKYSETEIKILVRVCIDDKNILRVEFEETEPGNGSKNTGAGKQSADEGERFDEAESSDTDTDTVFKCSRRVF